MSPARESDRWRSWQVRGALVVGSFVLSALLAEVILRGLFAVSPGLLRQRIQASPPNFGVAHPYIGHLQTPNSSFVVSAKDFRALHRTGVHGFRNPSPWPERADIVAVGDSLTFGHGVDDHQAWPAILSRALPTSRVMNLGLGATGPQQYLRVYEVFGVSLRPQILLVGLFPYNDFWDTGLFDRWLHSGVGGNYMVWRDTGRSRKREATRPRLRDVVASSSDVLARHSYLFNLLRQTSSSGKQRLRKSLMYTFRDGTQVRLLPDDFEDKTIGAKPHRHECQLVLEALRLMQETAHEHGTRMLVVVQPSKEEVYLPLLGVEFDDPARPVQEAMARLGIDYVNLTPLFREAAAAGRRLFFEEDGHPNAEGYRLIAEGVLGHLRARSYLDSGSAETKEPDRGPQSLSRGS
jgi:lysophospholipase L1-like esterase